MGSQVDARTGSVTGISMRESVRMSGRDSDYRREEGGARASADPGNAATGAERHEAGRSRVSSLTAGSAGGMVAVAAKVSSNWHVAHFWGS